MPEKGKLQHTGLCCVLLVLITLAVYLPVIELRFVTFDDSLYVTGDPKVQPGLTWDRIRWAFTCAHGANWHPLTWLSHMLDCELYGLKPAGHHFTNLLFHTANTLLLFGLLRRLTGAFWRSTLVAALFALHPLHVESVAWVAERKDVLSTFFFMLTLGAYGRYAEGCIQKAGGRGLNAEGGKRQAGGRKQARQANSMLPASRLMHQALRTTYYTSLFYSVSLLCFALGLMCKPMLVTLPFVLLLLDYWPLGRLSLSSLHHSTTPSTRHPTTPTLRLVLEKLPFFVLSAASCVTTLIVQWQGGAVVPLARELGMSLESRLMNTPVAYAWYLMKVIWPSDLAVIYPSVREWSIGWVLLAAVSLMALTGAAVWQRQRRPYVLVGWLCNRGRWCQ